MARKKPEGPSVPEKALEAGTKYTILGVERLETENGKKGLIVITTEGPRKTTSKVVIAQLTHEETVFPVVATLVKEESRAAGQTYEVLTEAEYQAKPRVYVDAKIVGRHEEGLPKKTYVAYVVENERGLHGVTEVEADETDDAELHAIEFAIQQLKGKLEKFTIVCDHESVVSVIQRNDRSAGRKRPVLLEVLKEMESNPSVRVELLANNPAHRLLNKYVAELQRT